MFSVSGIVGLVCMGCGGWFLELFGVLCVYCRDCFHECILGNFRGGSLRWSCAIVRLFWLGCLAGLFAMCLPGALRHWGKVCVFFAVLRQDVHI